LTFENPSDYALIDKNDILVLDKVAEAISSNTKITLFNQTKNRYYTIIFEGSDREKDVALNAGYLNYVMALELGDTHA
jgi:hypothetical protein